MKHATRATGGPAAVPPTGQAVADACRRMTGAAPVTGTQAEALAAYLGLLVKWNKAMNLVGPGDWRTMLDDLVADSLHLVTFLPGLGLPCAPRVLDLGAGAGLPGIPLRVMWDAGEYTMVEVRDKRAVFLQTAVAALGLGRTRVFAGRAEDALARHAPVDMIVSRAFMPWRALLDFVRGPLDAPFLAAHGRVVFLASEPAPEGGAMPDGWRVAAQAGYRAGGKDRWFWAVAPGR
ncbi:MAG: 16S rRNA (guanine(527)-N(7))-methyltransferase RsmG [Desulfovibrionaceae bacterium]